MQFFYGNYYHEPNEVAFSAINRSMRRAATGRAWILNVQWQLEGKLVGSQGDLYARLNGLIQAYGTDGDSAGMLDNNGGFTPFTINGRLALGGVRVTSPVSHGPLKGAEGSTYLHYKIGLEADFPWANANDPLSFTETLSFTNNNGGPIFIERIPALGPPILQQVTEQSWFFVTQQGSYSQAGPFPQPMQPIFPLPYIRTASNAGQQVTYTSPKMIGGAPVEYGVNWKYEYISTTPLIGWPNTVG